MSIMTAMPQGAAVEGINPNLLDNWYFVGGGSQQGGGQFPINQRGATSGQTTNNSYSLDRWKWSYGSSIGTWSLVSAGLTLTPVDSVQMIQLCRSLIEFPQRRLTASVLFSDGTFCSGSETLDANGTTQYWSGNNVVLRSVNYDFRVVVYETKTIVAVKLELGDQQTLARNLGTASSPNWVLNEIPDYATELLKCTGAMGDSGDAYSHKAYPFGLTHNLDLYVDVTNGSDSNDGLSASTALQTIAEALNRIPPISGGKAVSIYLASGTYPKITIANKRNYKILFVAASNANVTIQGMETTDSDIYNCVFQFFSITFTAQVLPQGHYGNTMCQFSQCIFDGATIASNGTVYFYQCTHRNIPATASAFTHGYGVAFVYRPTLENTVLGVGIKAGSEGIISVGTYYLSNSAAIPYDADYSGRIFVGNVEYGGANRIHVTLNNVASGSTDRTYTVKGITSSHVLVQEGSAYFSNPAVVASAITLTTGTDSVTVKGTTTGTTNIIATFEIPRGVVGTTS